MTKGRSFEGRLYRALNPIWASRPLSGEGAARFGGRFNPVGVPALYCSLDPLTALREANQVGDLQPTTLVALDARIADVFDSRDDTALAQFDMTQAALADPGWREAMLRGGEAPTQSLARRLREDGYAGILVPSFARGAGEGALNLVLWRWGERQPHRLSLIDDEQRLG